MLSAPTIDLQELVSLRIFSPQMVHSLHSLPLIFWLDNLCVAYAFIFIKGITCSMVNSAVNKDLRIQEYH